MPPTDEPGRADRLLTKMHRVLSHDLPNQIVALQSLLQLLELEEAARLGDEGRECVQRLHRVARKAAGQVRFLKEMGRLGTSRPCVGSVTMAPLLREVASELHLQMPAIAVSCRLVSDSGPFVADPRRLVLAVVEIARFLLERFPPVPCSLRVGSNATADGIEVRVTLHLDDGTTAAVMPARPTPKETLEVVLAEEMLASCGGRLSELCEERDSSRFTLLLSASTGHG